MELRALLVLFLRKWPLFSLSTVFFFALGFGVAASRPPAYRTVLDLYVKRQTQPPSDKFYSFDGYYSQQAAERYTQTVVGFLRSREVWREAAATVGQPTDAASLKKLERVIKVKEAAPQLVSLSVSGPEKDLVANLSLALARVAMLRLQALNQTGDTALSLELVTITPLLEKEMPSPWWGGLAGVAVSWLLLILFFSLREYLHDGTRT